MNTAQRGITIDILAESLPFGADLERLREMLAATLRRFRCRRAGVCVRVTDDREISRINRQYLGHKGPTDVVSFDLSEKKGPRQFDLVVSAQRAAAQARKRRHLPEAELALYALHGLLHCLGYDDIRPGDASKMHALEDEILVKHGYGAIYSCK
jgi:probable rRNA maturation factor